MKTIQKQNIDTYRYLPIVYQREDIPNEVLLLLYERMLLSRRIEERMLKLLRQGKVSKWFSGIGQEAIAVGATTALKKDDFILPMHRNLGVFISRGIDLYRLFCQWQGKKEGFTKGRDRSFHFGYLPLRIVGMISHLAAMLGVADGLALAQKLKKSKNVVLAFMGDGATSEGDFHEALNIAAVWGLPVIFLIENNGYALSTPTSQQYRVKHLADRAKAYGMEGVFIDGNNVLEVYKTVLHFAEKMRDDPQPVLIEAETFRMRGHEEASGTRYVPKELFEDWGKRDPLLNYEQFLLQEGILTPEHKATLETTIQETILDAWKKAEQTPDLVPNEEEELKDVYAPSSVPTIIPKGKRKTLRFVDAISEGLWQGMEKYPNMILMGQDIAEYGGVFKVTQGFLEQFGSERVRNTVLCESGIVAAAMGLALEGFIPVVEMQFADFVSMAFNQIVNNLAKTHYRWGAALNVTIRMPTGAGVGAGPFHSQSNEAWFFHVPGLKIVYPATPYDAKGLMLSAIEENNPVLYFEHKLLYRTIRGEVPEDYYTIPIGEAQWIQQGEDAVIITYGMGVHWAKEVVQQFPDYSIAILDLRTLLPLDKEKILESVRQCGKVLILHEDTLTGGIGAEIAAIIAQEAFEYLDAPIVRVASLDTPVPFNLRLEKQFLAKHRLKDALEQLLTY